MSIFLTSNFDFVWEKARGITNFYVFSSSLLHKIRNFKLNYIFFTFCIILISIDQNLVDWSIRGQIAVSFGHDVIIWQSKEDITMAFDIKCPRSLAYSPDGEFLAIGCKSCEYPGKCIKDNTETIMLNNF